MMTRIGRIGSAEAVAEVAGCRVCAATLQLRTQYISSEAILVCTVHCHTIQCKFASGINRAGGIRTHGLHVPNVAL